MSRNHPEFIIIHHSAGKDSDELEYRKIRWYHVVMRQWVDVGYHRLYERVNGVNVAIAGRPLNQNGAHAPGYNQRSVGVCFVGDYSHHPPSHDLLKVGARDIAGLCDTLDIPLVNVLPHRAVRPTECPGNAFPYDMLIALIQEYRDNEGRDWGRTA